MSKDHAHQHYFLLSNLIDSMYGGPVDAVTTDRTGKVDAAWRRMEGPDSDMEPVSLMPWVKEQADFNLRNLGGMARLYASHPGRDTDQVTVRLYEDWPAMVDLVFHHDG